MQGVLGYTTRARHGLSQVDRSQCNKAAILSFVLQLQPQLQLLYTGEFLVVIERGSSGRLLAGLDWC